MIPQEYLDAITAVFPCPVQSGYERAHWLYQCRNAVRWIEDFISSEYLREIAEIQKQNLISETFEIIPIQRQESRINIPLMREKYPEMFEELVFLKPSDAAKILGRKTLYRLAKEKTGTEPLQSLEQINVGDVERTMLKEQAAELIETRQKITDWEIRETA